MAKRESPKVRKKEKQYTFLFQLHQLNLLKVAE